MYDDYFSWKEAGRRNDWYMPTAPLWKRLPIIRHIRAAWHWERLAGGDAVHHAIGKVVSDRKAWVLWGMRRGFERQGGGWP